MQELDLTPFKVETDGAIDIYRDIKVGDIILELAENDMYRLWLCLNKNRMIGLDGNTDSVFPIEYAEQDGNAIVAIYRINKFKY